MKRIIVQIELSDYVTNILDKYDFKWNEEFELCAIAHAYKIKETLEKRKHKEDE